MRPLLRGVDGLLLFISPIALLFFLLCAILLPVNLREHPAFLERLAAEGRLAEGTVSAVLESGAVLVEYAVDDGAVRSEGLSTVYYSDAVRAALQPGTLHLIRYMPTYGDNQGPILEEQYATVRTYRKPLGGLYFLLGLSWLVLILRPDILYAGYVKNWTAVRAELPTEEAFESC